MLEELESLLKLSLIFSICRLFSLCSRKMWLHKDMKFH